MYRRLLVLYVFLLPYEGILGQLAGTSTVLKPYRLVGLVIIGLLFFRILDPKKRLRVDAYDTVYLVMFGWGLFMAVFWYLVAGTGRIQWALWDSTLIVFAFAVYLAIKNEADSIRDAELLLNTHVLGTLSSIILQSLLGVDATAGRMAGFYGNPNGFAVAIITALLVSISKLLFAPSRRSLQNYLWNGGVTITLVIALLFTGSRGPILGLLVSLAAFAIPLLRRSHRLGERTMTRLAGILPVLMIAGMGLSLAYTEYRTESLSLQRYGVEAASTGSGRFDIWRSAWNVAEDHYFLGVGTAQYRYYHRRYVSRLEHLYSPSVTESDLGVHSDYLNMLTSYGGVSLLMYLYMVFVIYRRLRRRLRDPAVYSSFAVAAYLPLLVFILVTESAHILMQNPQYYVLMALITVTVSPRPRGYAPGRPTLPDGRAMPALRRGPLSGRGGTR